MAERISLECCLNDHSELVIVDVRSPGEFTRGHIPGAVNIPLLSDEERALVGKTYREIAVGRAVELGSRFVESRLQYLVKQSLEVVPDGKIIVHCWRGGMRSSAFASLLEDNGFQQVYIIDKGYKSYRSVVNDFFHKPLPLMVLGGYTGSGKTEILHCLKEMGHQVADLENLANHRGSVFGGIGMPAQPTTEQFENELYKVLAKMNPDRVIWVEDESITIGHVHIPDTFFALMKKQPLLFIDIPLEERAAYLVKIYSGLNVNDLEVAITRIERRLGHDKVKLAVQELYEGNYIKVAGILLSYYDKYYLRGTQKREKSNVINISLKSVNPDENARLLSDYCLNQYKDICQIAC